MCERCKELEKTIERLRLDGWVDLSSLLEYQRRHRKWALYQAKANLAAYDAAHRMWAISDKRAEKAEARIKELEQEVLWAADACEKAEAKIAELQESNKSWLKVNADVIEERNKAQAELSACKKKLLAQEKLAQKRLKRLTEQEKP